MLKRKTKWTKPVLPGNHRYIFSYSIILSFSGQISVKRPYTASANRRERTYLPLENKVEIIHRLQNKEPVTSIAKIFGIGKSTVSYIKRRKDSILAFASRRKSAGGEAKRKKSTRSGKDEKSKTLFRRFVRKRSKGAPISGLLLRDKALIESNRKLIFKRLQNL